MGSWRDHIVQQIKCRHHDSAANMAPGVLTGKRKMTRERKKKDGKEAMLAMRMMQGGRRGRLINLEALAKCCWFLFLR